jgi:hypothetical protein
MNVMAEIGIIWPCPKDTDPEFHAQRIGMLGWHCRELAPGLLRKAIDLVAIKPGRPNTLATASEIMAAVEHLLAERAAMQRAVELEHRQLDGSRSQQPSSGITVEKGRIEYIPPQDQIDAAHEYNRRMIREGSPWRIVAQGNCRAHVLVEDNGTIVPNWRCNGDGTITRLMLDGEPVDGERV